MKNMKTLIIALLVTSTFIFNTEAQAGSASDKVHVLLSKVMSYPNFAKQSKATGVVYVSFKTLEDGSFKVLQLNASSKKFGEYVSKKLTALQFSTNGANQVYNYKFTFKPEK